MPLHPAAEQEAFRAELRFMLDKGVRIEQSQYSNALYVVHRNGDVYNASGQKLASDVPFGRPSGAIGAVNAGIDGRGWPLATWMKPDPGEGTMALYNPETGAYAEVFGARVWDGGMSYTWGGYHVDARRTTGVAAYASPRANLGANAHGGNLMAYTITDKEIREAVARYKAGDVENAYIPHMIGYEAYRHHRNEWHYPASRTDWTGTGTMTDSWCNGMPKVSEWGVGGCDNWLGNGRGILRMGGIVRLDPAVDVQTEIRGDGTPFGDMMARIFARTLQRHGMTMTDATEAGVALLAEHKRKTDGTYDRAGAFSYDPKGDAGSQVWHYGSHWLKPMLTAAIDQDWLQWVYTGRNLESDHGRPAPAGAYRPPVVTGG